MKVLHIIPSYFPAYSDGGPIVSVHALNTSLVKHGIEVVVYTTNLDGKNILDIPHGERIYRDGVIVYYFSHLCKAWKYSYALHKVLSHTVKDYDIVHITSTFLSVSTLGAYYAKKYKKPYIISPRGNLMRAPLQKNAFIKKAYISCLEKRNLKDATIHFTSQEEQDEYLETKLPYKDSFIIPNGLDFSDMETNTPQRYFRNKFNLSKEKKIILSLGRLNWKKGFDTLIPAFAEVAQQEPDTVLIIVGPNERDYKKEIQVFIAKHQLQNNVIFTGILLGKDKRAVLRESDVFVLPSYSENFGMAIVEAMYCELPVVITEHVGIADEVRQANAGIVTKKDVHEVAYAILDLLRNQEKGKIMGQNGKKMVQEKYSVEKIAKQFIEVYTTILQENRKKQENVLE